MMKEELFTMILMTNFVAII